MSDSMRLDLRVHEEVFQEQIGMTPVAVPRYSTDPRDCQLVLAWLEERGWTVTTGDGTNEIRVFLTSRGRVPLDSRAATREEAICLAALKVAAKGS